MPDEATERATELVERWSTGNLASPVPGQRFSVSSRMKMILMTPSTQRLMIENIAALANDLLNKEKGYP